MSNQRNWHSIVGPNGMCECGVNAAGEVVTCGELLRAVPRPPQENEAQRKFERSQQRWGNLKKRIEAEIVSFTNPCLSTQQRHQYQNGVARLRWVLDEMRKSPDVLAEAVPAAAPPPVQADRLAWLTDEVCRNASDSYVETSIDYAKAPRLKRFAVAAAAMRAVLVAAAPPAPGGDR